MTLTVDLPEEKEKINSSPPSSTIQKSELRNWPIQIKLLPIQAAFYRNADILLSADCVGSSYPSLHATFVKGRTLMIGCPKLDDSQFYVDKLAQIFKYNNIRSVHVLMMTVPCCSGLLYIAQKALELSGKKKIIPLTQNIIDVQGTIKF